MNFLCRRGFFARKCQGGSVIYRREFRRSFFLSLPPGGKVPSVCEADEGAIIERFLCRARRPGAPILEVCAGNFAAAAATYFAHVGSSSQWPRPPSLVPSGQFTLSPLHCVSAWRRKLRSFPCSSSSRRTRFVGLRREQRGIGQNAPGDAADGLRLRFAPPRSIGPLSPDPITGVNPSARQIISGVQNLSECLNSRRATGPWVCRKLGQARFHNRACLCRTNGTGSVDDGRPKGLPYPKWESILDFRRGGACPSRKAFPFRGRWLAEGQTDEGNGPSYKGGPFEP